MQLYFEWNIDLLHVSYSKRMHLLWGMSWVGSNGDVDGALSAVISAAFALHNNPPCWCLWFIARNKDK